jgi:hypothetical protein
MEANYKKHVYAFVDFLGKLLVKCLESRGVE